ncbi:MAG: T9SS type A sorting domain-containing protein [Bacteroidota bacterium]
MKTIINFSTFSFVFSLVFCLSFMSNSASAQSIQEEWDDNGESGEYSDYNDCMLTGNCPGTESFAQKENVSLLPSIKLSPNPAVGNFMKVWYNQLVGTSVLSVLDLSGKIIHRASVGNNRDSEGMYEMNTSELSPGVYIVQLQSGIYKAVQKVIIRK